MSVGLKGKKQGRATRVKAPEGHAVVGDVSVAYAIVPSVGNHGNLFHLLVMNIVGDRVVRVERDVEDLRGIKLAKLHDHAMADA